MYEDINICIYIYIHAYLLYIGMGCSLCDATVGAIHAAVDYPIAQNLLKLGDLLN